MAKKKLSENHSTGVNCFAEATKVGSYFKNFRVPFGFVNLQL